jgi:hypothetical protein
MSEDYALSENDPARVLALTADSIRGILQQG